MMIERARDDRSKRLACEAPTPRAVTEDKPDLGKAIKSSLSDHFPAVFDGEILPFVRVDRDHGREPFPCFVQVRVSRRRPESHCARIAQDSVESRKIGFPGRAQAKALRFDLDHLSIITQG